MYSRYIPDGRGGHQRQPVPDTHPEPSPPISMHPPAPSMPNHTQVMPLDHDTPPERPIPPHSVRPPRPAAPGRPPPRPGASALLGRNPLIGLFTGIDTEDLLILAVLILALKEDGADRSVIWIAVILYFMM